MSPQSWLRFILEMVERYERGEPRPLQQLAKRLSKLDGDNDDDHLDDPITDKIWGRPARKKEFDDSV